MCCFVYPVVAHWVWHTDGWLKDNDFIDFAGSGAVHLLGGASGFVGTFLLKPRYDIFGTYPNPFIEKTPVEPNVEDIVSDDARLSAITTQIFDTLEFEDPETATLGRDRLR